MVFQMIFACHLLISRKILFFWKGIIWGLLLQSQLGTKSFWAVKSYLGGGCCTPHEKQTYVVRLHFDGNEIFPIVDHLCRLVHLCGQKKQRRSTIIVGGRTSDAWFCLAQNCGESDPVESHGHGVSFPKRLLNCCRLSDSSKASSAIMGGNLIAESKGKTFVYGGGSKKDRAQGSLPKKWFWLVLSSLENKFVNESPWHHSHLQDSDTPPPKAITPAFIE